jgi:tRNA G26 N,N-dimethylase Trm1
MTTQEIRAMLTAIARQYAKGDIFNPAKGAWIDIDHYIRRYNEEPAKDKVVDEMFANIDDIKTRQGIQYLDAKKRNWVKL